METLTIRLPDDKPARFKTLDQHFDREGAGDAPVLIPVASVWGSYFDKSFPVSEDFMCERDEDGLPQESRESLDG